MDLRVNSTKIGLFTQNKSYSAAQMFQSPFHRCRLSWRSAPLWVSGSPGLWFWRGVPAPARAAAWGFPWAPGAPSASPRATLPSARSTWQCDGAAPALAPASPPAPCRAPACLPLGSAMQESENLCHTCSTSASKVNLPTGQKPKTSLIPPLFQFQDKYDVVQCEFINLQGCYEVAHSSSSETCPLHTCWWNVKRKLFWLHVQPVWRLQVQLAGTITTLWLVQRGHHRW